MRIVLWTSYAKLQIVARLKPILGDDLVVVSDFQEFARVLPEADALICPDFIYNADVAAALRERAKRLRWLQLLTAGFESTQRHSVPPGISVSNAGDAYSPAVAMHAVAMLLALHRRFPTMLANQSRHDWNRAVAMALTTPSETTAAILGFGSIGREIARLLRTFGVRIIGLSRAAAPHALADEAVPIGRLREILPRADAIMLALPLDPSTQGLIGASELAICRKNAILINISRGGVVDTTALTQALQNGTIAGAGLDVTDPEPLPADHLLWDAPNLIISPHLAGASGVEGFERLAAVAADNVERFRAGKPLAHLIQL